MLSEHATFLGTSRLTVVGTLNEVTVPGVPVQLPPMFLSMVIEAHPDEAGTEHKLEVRVLDAQRGEVFKAGGTFTFKKNPPRPGLPVRHSHIVQMQVGFKKEGPYSFEVFIDGTYSAATTFYVNLDGKGEARS